MKIKKLIIKNYKNLETELLHNSDIIALIGNNGSGKSNSLEAMSQIFRSLYKDTRLDFNYEIEYENSLKNLITIVKSGSGKPIIKVDNKAVIDYKPYLPKKVVAIYSGEEQRLWEECYWPFYEEFVAELNKAKNVGIGEYSNLPNMLYLNKFYWNLCLLCLILSDSEDNKKFVKEVLKIDKIDKIGFQFDTKNYAKYNGNLALELVNILDNKNEYELKELKDLLLDYIYTPLDVFKYLYLAFTPKDSKILTNIIVKFNNNLDVKDLSEGEKKLILIKAAMEFAGQEDSLFILDEPDAHIHVNNKSQITDSFVEYKNNRQIIITTHSPTLTQSLTDDNVYMLNSGKVIAKDRQEIIEEITGEFWNKHQQSSFLSSKKPIILFVEGKHDKEHITNAFNKLKDEYFDLLFDVYNLNGAANIPQILTGLRTSDLDLKKTFIGIFDNDDEGKEHCNKTQVKYISGIKCKHSGFYAIKYENDLKINQGNGFTVENMFAPEHYEKAYFDALESFRGKFENKFIDHISKDIKDLAKSKLCENSKNFEKEDYANFRKLFDLIREIKNLKSSNATNEESLSLSKNENKEVVNIVSEVKAVGNKATEEEIKGIEIYTKFRNTDVNAVLYSQNQILIKKGSKVSRTIVPSLRGYSKERNKLLKNKSELVNDTLILTDDIPFDSVSGAIKFVCGSNVNGWYRWLLKSNDERIQSIRENLK